MSRFQGDLPERTFRFALRIVVLMKDLPHDPRGWVVANQVMRSGTSIGVNIREAGAAPTDTDFAHCCNIARKEASGTHYWLLLCKDSQLLSSTSIATALIEADEILRILSTVVKKSRRHITHRP